MKVIIVPTDFSENAANAMRCAIQMSKSHYYKLVFLHVYSLPFLNPEAGMVYDASLSESMRLQSDKALREHVEKVFDSLGMHRNLLLSELEVLEAISLAGAIEKMHQRYHADLVVMGTHGATGLKKFFLGSNAADVIQNTQIPVLTIPDHYSFNHISIIAYASDLDNIDIEIKKVVAFAEAFHAQVHVIHVANEAEAKKNLAIDPLVKKWESITNYKKINLHMIQGAEKISLTDLLKILISEIDADMLVMFHEQRNFWKSLFEKSMSAEVIYEWTSPVLTMSKH